jgi:hypothetical protein
MKNKFNSFSGWRYGTFGIIALFSVLLIIRWQNLPVFLDIYYHASCMMGFKEAGGIVLHDFWEYAPAGRPHLYPPLFPVVLLGMAKSGLPIIFILRLACVAIYPLMLSAIAWVVTKLYNDRCAFFTILAASLPYTFFLNVITAIPASISLILLVLLFYAVETRRTICGILLLGLSFYTHGALPWISILTLILYAGLKRDNIKSIILIAIGGIALGSPWLIHAVLNKSYFSSNSLAINKYFDGNIFLYLFALAGLLIALKKKGRSLFFLAMIIAMLPMIKNYTFRFLCGEGLLPIIFLAGIGLDGIYSKTAEFLKSRTRPIIYLILLPWLLFYVVTFHSPGGSAFSKFANYNQTKASALESSIYMKKYMEELADIIEANTASDDIIYCNYNYAAGIFYTLSGRAASSGMLNEVKPSGYSDPAVSTKLIIWIKNPEGTFDPELKLLISRLNLAKVAETEFAYVYKNPGATAHKIVPKPVVNSNMALLTLFVWTCAIFVYIIIL